MNRLLTAETRPRFSSGVRICTSVWRTTTLMLSTAPARASNTKDSQNQAGFGNSIQRPRQFTLESPNRTVATPNTATDQSIARPAFCSGGRCAIMNAQMTAPTAMALRSHPNPPGPV